MFLRSFRAKPTPALCCCLILPHITGGASQRRSARGHRPPSQPGAARPSTRHRRCAARFVCSVSVSASFALCGTVSVVSCCAFFDSTIRDAARAPSVCPLRLPVSEAVHRRGVNIRHIGLLRSMLHSNEVTQCQCSVPSFSCLLCSSGCSVPVWSCVFLQLRERFSTFCSDNSSSSVSVVYLLRSWWFFVCRLQI